MTPFHAPREKSAEVSTEVLAADRAHYCLFSRTGARGGINQDAVLAVAPHFFGVADGVGGGVHGDVASRTALDYCSRASGQERDDLGPWINQVDQVVRQTIATLSAAAGATTLAVLWLEDRHVVTCHVGDSRIYRLRPDLRGRYQLTRLTEDHTYRNSGITPPAHGSLDDPCQMLGAGPPPQPAISRFTARGHDLYLLCTDGLHRYVTDQGLRFLVNQGLHRGLSLREICEQLADNAVANKSRDDISIVLVSIRPKLWFF